MGLALPRWLKAPVFPGDEERTRTARILHTLVVCRVSIVLLLFIVIALPFLFANREASAAIASAELLVEGTAWWLNQRGRVRAGSLVLVLGSWVIVTFLLLTAGGIESTNHVYYLALVVMAGLLLGSRWAYALAAMCLIAEGTFLALWVAKVPLPLIYPVPPPAILVNVAANLLLVTIVLVIAVNSLEATAKRARDALEERQRAEAERERIRAELAQSQKMESVGRLAGTIAHDFNNLLCAMMSHIELARLELPEGSSAHEDLEDLDRITQSATELTRGLLVFSRRQDLELEPVDLGGLLQANRRLLEGLLGDRCTLRLDLAPEPWALRADPTQLQRVLVNLVVNARDAMPEGGTLSLGTANVRVGDDAVTAPGGAPAGDYVRLTVRDTGTGLSEEARRHLFEPFFTTKPKGQGTGLGLATVFGIVRQHGGTLEVESEPGAGAAFHLYLPRAVGPIPPREAPAAPESTRGAEVLLLVEDEGPLRHASARFLTRLGYTVVTASSFDEAIEAAAAAPRLDLLVTDVKLGALGGRAVADALTATRPDLPVVFVSGCTPDELAREGVDAAATSFLAKPYAPRDLGALVRGTLDSLSDDAPLAPVTP